MGKEHTFEIDFELDDKTSLKSKFTVSDGDDAFETFKSIPGNEEKTIDDFYTHIEGTKGNGVVGVSLVIDDEPEDPEETSP